MEPNLIWIAGVCFVICINNKLLVKKKKKEMTLIRILIADSEEIQKTSTEHLSLIFVV